MYYVGGVMFRLDTIKIFLPQDRPEILGPTTHLHAADNITTTLLAEIESFDALWPVGHKQFCRGRQQSPLTDR